MKFILLSLITLLLALGCLFVGSVSLAPSDVFSALLAGDDGSTTAFIVWQHRLPMVITAILAGSALAVSGLLLQTAFRNPLAGPSVLGINSGASLGVAIVMLGLGGSLSVGTLAIGGQGAVIAGAFLGSMLVMGILLLLSAILRNPLMLLICGIMVGYLTSSAITLLNFAADATGSRSYLLWGMSSFSGIPLTSLPLFAILTLLGLGCTVFLVKPLNLLGLGDSYAENLGVSIRRVRLLLLFATGLLTAVATAYCGPVSFIGLSVPHIARIFFPTDNHRILLPATLLAGAAVSLGCCLMCVMGGSQVLPLNAVTPLVGAPVVIYILLKKSA